MAKRAPAHEGPYRPLLDPGVIGAALAKTAAVPGQQLRPIDSMVPSRVVELQQPGPVTVLVEPRATEQPLPARAATGEGRAALTVQQLTEKFDQEKRILLTRTEAAALDRLVNSLAARLNSQVKLSHVLRSLISLLLHAEGEVDKRAGEAPGLVRPPNGDGKALQRFERDIALILGAAIRDAGPIR